MIRGKHWLDGWLTVFWGRAERGEPKDIVYAYPNTSDGHLLHYVFSCLQVHGENSLLKELEERGYDIETLQFSIKRKWKPNEKPPQN